MTRLSHRGVSRLPEQPFRSYPQGILPWTLYLTWCLLEAGMTYEQIGYSLRLSKNGVHQRIKRLYHVGWHRSW